MSNVAFDLMFFKDKDSTSNYYEIMVWLEKHGDPHPLGAENPLGVVNIGGRSFQTYAGSNSYGQYCVSFVLQGSAGAGGVDGLDLSPFVKHVLCAPGVTDGPKGNIGKCLSTNAVMNTVDAGIEPFTGMSHPYFCRIALTLYRICNLYHQLLFSQLVNVPAGIECLDLCFAHFASGTDWIWSMTWKVIDDRSCGTSRTGGYLDAVSSSHVLGLDTIFTQLVLDGQLPPVRYFSGSHTRCLLVRVSLHQGQAESRSTHDHQHHTSGFCDVRL